MFWTFIAGGVGRCRTSNAAPKWRSHRLVVRALNDPGWLRRARMPGRPWVKSGGRPVDARSIRQRAAIAFATSALVLREPRAALGPFQQHHYDGRELRFDCLTRPRHQTRLPARRTSRLPRALVRCHHSARRAVLHGASVPVSGHSALEAPPTNELDALITERGEEIGLGPGLNLFGQPQALVRCSCAKLPTSSWSLPLGESARARCDSSRLVPS